MSFKSKMNKLNTYRKAKIFVPATFNHFLIKIRRHQMSELQLGCAKASLTQYLECLLLAKLRKKFSKQIKATAERIKEENVHLSHRKSKIIWVCWLQGIDNAPLIVRICYQSLINTFGAEYEIRVITDDNYAEYIDFPQNIIEKYKKGIISKTHFSDLIRLELLIRYGGIWADSTLLFNGSKLPEYMTDSDLFLFQSIWPQLFGRATRTESWFISACQNHPMLIFVRDMLYEYWKKYNILIDYWLVYDMFEFAIENFKTEWDKVVPVSQADVHIFQDRFNDRFNKDVFDITMKRVPIHKLNWRYDEGGGVDTVYAHIINNFKAYQE